MIKNIRSKINIIAISAAIILSFGRLTGNDQYQPVKFLLDSLPNGLHVIYQIDKSAPIVATVLHYNVGSHDENPGQHGYAHFFEHLMFEATTDIPRASIPKYTEEAGGTLNASTSFDQTVYYFKMTSNEVKLPLWIDSERMRKLKIDSLGVNTQRGVVLEEMKQRTQNSPYGTMMEKMCAGLMAGSYYSWQVIGSADDIKKAKIEDFKNFYDNFYQPNNAVLVIVGDYDLQEMKKWVSDYYGIYPKGDIPKRNEFKVDPIPQASRETVEDEKAQLPAVFIGYRGPSILDSNFYAMDLLSDILSSGESSRLYQSLVNEEQLAASVRLSNYSLEYAGMLIFNAIASPGKKLEDIEASLHEQINKLLKDGITDEELTKAKNIKEVEFVSHKKSVLRKANLLARYFTYYHDANLINTELDNYLKVTKQDLMRVAKQYFGTDKNLTLYYIPKGKKK